MAKIKNFLDFCWKEFIHGGHLQCLGIVSIVFISASISQIKITWDILFLVYLIFYPIYVYNHLKEIDIDESTNPERVKHLRSCIWQTYKFFYFSIFLLVVMLVYFSNFVFSIFALLLLFFGLLYTIIFKSITNKIFALKNFYVSAFFSIIALSPLLYYSYPLNFTLIFPIIIFMIFVYFKALFMQVLLDIKDIESDQKIGLLTIPSILGKEKTFTFLKLFSVLLTAPILIFSFFFNIFPESILLLLLTIPFNFYCLNLIKHQKSSGYILGSGEFFLWLILFIFGEIIIL